MSSFNTLQRAICTVALVLGLTRVAAAQSELNFVRSVQDGTTSTGMAITNTSSYFADVQFTFYNPDGTIVSNGLINPVSWRIPPKGQISKLSSEIFGTTRTEGWIQATSATSGLHGAYFSGDFKKKVEGSGASSPLTTQIIPYLRVDAATETTIFLTNPGLQNATGTVYFYNDRGESAGISGPIALAPHAQAPVRVVAGQSARVTANVPILATAVLETRESLMFITGQSVDAGRSARVIPHFVSGSGYDSILALANPTSDTATVTVTLFSETGGNVIPFEPGPSSITFTIPPHGAVTRDTSQITQFPLSPPNNGWLRIDSPDVPLDGLAIVSSGLGATVVPLQADATRVVFSQASENLSFQTELALVHAAVGPATVTVTLTGDDGRTIAQRDVIVGSRAKTLLRVRDLLPVSSTLDSGFVTIRSASPFYSVEMLSAIGGQFLTAVTPQSLESGFVPPPVMEAPALKIDSIELSSDLRPGTAFRISVSNAGSDLVAIIGGQVVVPRSNPFSRSEFFVDIPAQIEPGFVSFRIRSGGVDTTAQTIRILDPNGFLTQTLRGDAFYQKTEVTDAGLDTSRTVMVPIRNARVEVVVRSSQTVAAVSQTDDRGQFQVSVPLEPVTIRVASRLREMDLRVEDNTNANELYYISSDVDMRDPPSRLLLTDTTRTSGAFNILEMVQRGNDLVVLADPSVSLPPVTIFWSVRNTSKSGSVRDGNIGGTYFNLSSNTAFILGDRATDSDEFDDSVIIHEYAHMLAARFSRDDSPGGIHGLGDMLDPRVAWSEGWANFFSSAARNNPIYRDSRGLNGASVLRYDLEENVPIGDRPGYWSEGSVESLLWDLIDETSNEDGDTIELPFRSVWTAFTEVKGDRFVYLPYFLDHFVERNPLLGDALRTMVQLRTIDFQPNVRPSVTNPFPRPIALGENVTGEVDSLTLRRSNIIQSSHFFSFTTAGGAASIRMDIQGLGPGNNSNANDLDLFLMDANGRALEKSDRGLNGQSELISIRLPAGTYVVEVRSFYKRLETNEMIFNSGRYRLNVLVQ